MKKVLIILSSLFVGLSAYGQETKEVSTKMELFVSQTGVIVKYEDFKLDNIKSSFGEAQAKIRKVTSGGEVRSFYQISNEGKYGTKKASIAYEDLIELQKALTSLKAQGDEDINTVSDYVENKFVTDDGFEVGYFVSSGKLSWYMKLEKYGNGTTVFMKDVSTIETAFNIAKSKMEELK